MKFGRVRFVGVIVQCLLVQACLFPVPGVRAQGIAAVTAHGRPLMESFARSALSVRTTARNTVRFEVFLAQDAEQRARGLMFVEDLPENVGMLFLYDVEHEVTMWMKNTPLPLDMLFIDSAGRVVNIVRGTIPYSLGNIRSGTPAIAALELKAGTAARWGIRIGDRVEHELLGAR